MLSVGLAIGGRVWASKAESGSQTALRATHIGSDLFVKFKFYNASINKISGDNAGVPRMKFEDNEMNGDETGEEFGVEYSHALKRMTKNLD